MSKIYVTFFTIVLTAIFTNSNALITTTAPVITQSPCATNQAKIDFDITGHIGDVTIIWTPSIYVGTHLVDLPTGSYSVNLTDDTDSIVINFTIDPQVPILASCGVGICNKNFIKMRCRDDPIPSPPGYNNYGVEGAIGGINAAYGIIPSGGTGTIYYEWSSTGGTFNDYLSNSPSFSTHFVNQNVTILLTLTDDAGCSLVMENYFILHYIYPEIISITGAIDGQSDGSVTIIFPEDNNDAYTEDMQLVADDYSYYSGYVYPSTLPYTFNDLAAGDYNLYYNVLVGCYTTFPIVVPTRLNLSLPLFVNSEFDSSEITVDGIGPYTYQWSNNDDGSTTYLTAPNAANPGFIGTSAITYKLIITDSTAKTGTATTIYNPIMLIADSFISYCGATFQPSFTVSNSLSYSVLWTPSLYLNDAILLNPIFNIPTSQNYSLIITDQFGYIIEQSINITKLVPEITYQTGENCGISKVDLTNFVATNFLPADLANGCWKLRKDTTILNQASSLNIPSITDLDYGTYYFDIDCISCPFSQELNLDPSLQIITSEINYCDSSKRLEIISSFSPGEVNYLWTASDPSVIITDATQRMPTISTPATSAILNLELSFGSCAIQKAINFIFSLPDYIILNQSCSSRQDGRIHIDGNSCTWSDYDSDSCDRQVRAGTYNVVVHTECKSHSLQLQVYLEEEIDFDNDGVGGCTDLCPHDPLKIAPGQCGCDQPDTDTDSDQIADCVDLCPNNAAYSNQSCPTTVIINSTKPTNSSSNHQFSVSVNITFAFVNITLNILSVDDRNVDNISINPFPLIELDRNQIVQSLNVNKLNWTHTLINYNGYKILTANAYGPIDYSRHHIDKSKIVNLTYYYYFFEANCRYQVINGYGVGPIECSQNLPNATAGYEYYQNGDNKLSFEVKNWPFLKKSNKLRTQIIYESFNGLTGQTETSEDENNSIVIYHTNNGLTLILSLLKFCDNDDQKSKVNLIGAYNGIITIEFDSFHIMKYDPSLRMLFSGFASDDSTWIWKAGMISAVTMAGLGLLVVLSTYIHPIFYKTFVGKEPYRIMKLRRGSKKFGDSYSHSHNSKEMKGIEGTEVVNKNMEDLENNK